MADIANISDKILKQMMNPLFGLPVGDNAPEEVNMLVEIPMGSINKYEYNTQTGLLKLDRVLFEKLPYPVEYGCIPRTWDEDEDLLDVISLVSYPTFPGCLISGRVVGVMRFNDTGEVDDKILVVPDDIRFKHIKDIGDLTEHQKEEITFFFERYKDLQYKFKGQTDAKTIVEGWYDKAKAYEIIEKAMKRFEEKFKDQL